MSDFPDYFSAGARAYASFRPRYPKALYSFLAQTCEAHALAWDCATGSGQAALDLAPYFAHVEASDASAQQIAQAQPHPQVAYSVARAEHSDLATGSVDLITVAQALHWFDLPAFYAEARRVLTARGLIAVWTYGVFEFEDPVLNALMQEFYAHTLGPYWPPERAHVETGYRNLAFPFEELAVPAFELEAQLSCDTLVGYLGTWSAVAVYKNQIGHDPVRALLPRLRALWGSRPTHALRWPLKLRLGRNSSAVFPSDPSAETSGAKSGTRGTRFPHVFGD